MPEIPDLEAIAGFLNRHLPGVEITGARVLIPIVVRASKEEFARTLEGNSVQRVWRHGKFLVFDLRDGGELVVHPMLTGRFQYCGPEEKRRPRTCWLLALANSHELRYADERLMGKTYLASRETLNEVPRYSGGGPDALDVSEEEFHQRIRRFTGMVKNVLTNDAFIAGIGNAYADEVLFEAGFHPFRRRSTIDDEGIGRLHQALRAVLEESIPIVAAKMEESLDYSEWRDHLKVHRRGGQPCPRCGTRISEITAGGRVTSFCRRCQK